MAGKNGDPGIGAIAVAVFGVFVIVNWSRRLREPRTVHKIQRGQPQPRRAPSRGR